MKTLAKMLSLSFAIIVFSTLVIQAQDSTPTSEDDATSKSPSATENPNVRPYFPTSKSAYFPTSKSLQIRKNFGNPITITSGKKAIDEKPKADDKTSETEQK
jgi:hypothetical protein